MTLTLRSLALTTALGLSFGTAAQAEVTIRYLASHGGLAPHELADELGYYDEAGIKLENLGYASGGPETLIGLAGGSLDLGSAATSAVLNSIIGGNDFVAAIRRRASTTTCSRSSTCWRTARSARSRISPARPSR